MDFCFLTIDYSLNNLILGNLVVGVPWCHTQRTGTVLRKKNHLEPGSIGQYCNNKQICTVAYFRTHWIHFASKRCLILIFTICQGLKPSSGECDPLCSVDEISSQEFEANYQPKTDLLKAVAIFAAAATGAVAINHSWVAANQVSFIYTKVGL